MMENSDFRGSFCNPFNPKIIELGDIPKDKVIESFEKIPWNDFLEKVKNSSKEKIYYSPSFEIENKDSKHGLSVSIIDDNEWCIFYKRPKQVRKLFGLINYLEENYISEVFNQTKEQVIKSLESLIDGNLDYLERNIR